MVVLTAKGLNTMCKAYNDDSKIKQKKISTFHKFVHYNLVTTRNDKN